MLRNLLFILIIFAGLSCQAAENFLNSVVIQNNEGETSIILRADETAKVKRDVEASDKVILTLKGITQSPDINTLYKNTSDIKGLAIQNEGSEVKIYIEAPDISKANVVFETPNSAPVIVSSNVTEEKALWAVVSIVLLLLTMSSAKMVRKPKQKDISDIIKEREMKLYRNFQKEVATAPSMNYKLKSYRKHVLKGDTIRNYEKTFSRV